jgi:hypothetical protein
MIFWTIGASRTAGFVPLLLGAIFISTGLYALAGRFLVDAWIRRDLRIRKEPLARLGGGRLLSVPVQERVADRFLESPDLLTHRRLGAVDALARPGKSAGIHHRHEGPQEIEVEHERLIRKSTDYDDMIPALAFLIGISLTP